jgi:acetyl esterase/lipase
MSPTRATSVGTLRALIDPRTIFRRTLPFVTVAAMAAALPLGTATAQSPSPGSTVKTAIKFGEPKGIPLYLDAYQPAGDGPFGAIILVHGGGWQFGERENLAQVARYLANKGFAAFTIDYRRSNRQGAHYNPYPAAVQDIRRAIRWVRSHADTYHVDPKRLGLLGSSAGGQLVSLVGMEGRGHLDSGVRVKAIVAWSGPQDMVELERDGIARARTAVEAFTNCTAGLPACEPILKEVSPLSYVDPSDPPLFFANGTHELVPLPGAQEMDAALTAAGVPHHLVVVPGSRHAQHYSDSSAPGLPNGQTVLQASLAWLQQWVNGVRPTAPPTPAQTDQANSRSGSGSTELIVLAVIAGAILLFVAGSMVVVMRRRRRRARRVREWREGQSESGHRDGGRSRSSRSRTRHHAL